MDKEKLLELKRKLKYIAYTSFKQNFDRLTEETYQTLSKAFYKQSQAKNYPNPIEHDIQALNERKALAKQFEENSKTTVPINIPADTYLYFAKELDSIIDNPVHFFADKEDVEIYINTLLTSMAIINEEEYKQDSVKNKNQTHKTL